MIIKNFIIKPLHWMKNNHFNNSQIVTEPAFNVIKWTLILLWHILIFWGISLIDTLIIYYIAINLFFHHQSISVDVINHLYLTHTIKLMTLVHSVHVLSKINLKFCKYYIIFLKYGYFNEFNDGPAETKCMKLPR